MKTSVLYCGHTRGPRLLPIKREINNKGKYVGIKAMEKGERGGQTETDTLNITVNQFIFQQNRNLQPKEKK